MLVKEKGYDSSLLEDDFDDLKDFWYGLDFFKVYRRVAFSSFVVLEVTYLYAFMG